MGKLENEPIKYDSRYFKEEFDKCRASRETDDVEFLSWLHQRLVNVHKEDPYYDYMWRLREVIARINASRQIWR